VYTPTIFIQFLRYNFKRLSLSSILAIIFFLTLSNAQTLDDVKTSKKVMKNFMDKRFDMFIHFGPVTLRATEIGWSRNKEVSAEIMIPYTKNLMPFYLMLKHGLKQP